MPEWRFLAQNILTGEWLDSDLPLKRDAEQPLSELSGAGSLTGTISGDHPTLRDGKGETVLREWSTALYAELDGEIVWGGILQDAEFAGADWNVKAYGFTSYANGIPYTGDYQKFVDVDPGVVIAKLWQHVQAQPDGNLGLRLVIPPDLGPNIGTKDEPYELAWWEAKDVGAEFQQFASEQPFDYLEQHAWAVPTRTTGARGLPSIRYAYGNLQGGYTGTDKGWMTGRAPGQVTLIGSMQVDLFVAVELHEETSTAMPKGAHRWFESQLQAKLHPAWKVAEGNGGNHLCYRSDLYAVGAATNRSGIPDPAGLGGNMRSASRFPVTHIATGYQFEVGAYHLHANDTNGTDRQPTRVAEAHDVKTLFPKTGRLPAIVAGDWNDWRSTPDRVLPIIESETGLTPLKRRTQPVNGNLNTLGTGRDGRWIDEVLTRPAEWDVSDARGVPTRGLSDHGLWLQLVATPRIAQGSTSVASASRAVVHTCQLVYPRTGRRRGDLKFVLGDNVLDVVTATRDGSLFANSVIVLGKGEGAKTLRGEDTVRDGRLRRPTVYTDKLASTAARCQALAKRERAWRGLNYRVDSIVVDGSHPNAPMRSWQLGDDILLEAYDLPHIGRLVDWYRVTGWAPVTDTTARLVLVRADAFTYGPTVPAPTDSGPDLESGTR